MGSLYTVKNKYTYEEYRRYMIYISFFATNARKMLILYSMVVGALIALGCLLYNMIVLISCPIIVIILAVQFFVRTKSIFYYIGNCAQNVRIFAYKIKAFLFVPQDWGTEGVEALEMLFYSNKILADREETVSFYDDFLVADRGVLNVRYAYDKIYEVNESKTNFYIMLTAAEGLIILKENCSDELCEFVRRIKKG